MKKPHALIVFLLIAGVVAAVGLFFSLSEKSSSETGKKDEFRQAPELVFRAFIGDEIRLSDFRGKPLLVNAWASWCPFCKDELIEFAALKKEYGDRIEILAVNRAEGENPARRYAGQFKADSGILFAFDPDDSLYKAIGGFSMPETVFVDSEGRIRDHKRGPMKLEEMRRRIQNAFAL